jgi:cyclic pyranopterin monophosphate synthase
MEPMEGAPLTHLDAAGRARMVDVSAKAATERWARARAVVRMSPVAAARVAAGDNPKGDVAAVARIAAIQAAKRTDELIPLAHSLPLTHVDPTIAIDPDEGTVTVVAEARTTDRTGVEMEAMVACSVAALTVYDMVKGIEPGVVIERVELLDKTGGKADFHRSRNRSSTATDARSEMSGSRSPTAATSAASTACPLKGCRG